MGVDLIGSGKKFVAVFDKPKNSKKRDIEIATEIVKHNPNVKSVLKISSPALGIFRKRKKKFVWGNKDTEVVHKEHGYILKVDPKRVYFSPREAEIRQKIAAKIRPKETIMIMFAGVGPYALAISKKQPGVNKIIAIELSPIAYKYMLENVRMNKISHLVTPVMGDVAEVSSKFYGACDRVIMPMIFAKNYIRTAVRCLRGRGTIYIYMVSKEKELFKDAEKFFYKTFKKLNKRYEIKSKNKISLFAPRKWKVTFEIQVKK